ncbi:hypothetical protein OG730_05060 [Streptomyces sp. NBC_01298]|uniref:hypothetical protein n=1 Tax=Streptomyces sp. NBC_01298 TaxID=2903817 RepID=UPI002E15604B|nr:hypothetical protein OG730_05060 [Streptomyces sp. NBC_01298]
MSTAAVLGTHVLAQRRERRHRLWDRRMDTYAEVLRSREAIARTRRDVLRDKKVFEETLDPNHDMKVWGLTEAKLEMFGSAEIKKLSEESFATIKAWTLALIDWHRQTQIASVVPNGEAEADAKWAEVERQAGVAARADTKLADAIKREAEFKKAEK